MLYRSSLASLLVGVGLSAVLFASCQDSMPTDAAGGGAGAAGGSATGGSAAGGSATGGGAPLEPPRRVVGYLPTYRSLEPSDLDFDALTHLCIAFANPTGVGSESDFEAAARPKIAPLVSAAHEKGVKVLASIAGGTKETGTLVGEQLVAARVDAYIAGLLAVVATYELDGIDVDLEGEHVTETYEPFVKKLALALPAGKLLSAAVATANGKAFSTAALREYDFINVMAYDYCGWSVEPCEHSSFETTLAELKYWTEERSYPKDKTVLGVPFYGWCWGCAEKQTAMTYAQILSEYPDAKTDDFLEVDGRTISLNSPPTIAKKAEVAQDYGGIMVWELGQDASGDDALFRVIAAAN